MSETSAPPVELFTASGMGMAYAGRWHNAANVKNGDKHVASLGEDVHVEQVYGALPALDHMQLRQPWSHIVKYGIEAWSPSMRILDETGAVQMQCTRQAYKKTFALFGGQRKRMNDLQGMNQKPDASNNNIAVNIVQGLPLPEEIAQPNSQNFQESPLWIQVVAAIEHLRAEMQWHVSRNMGFPGQGGYDHNSHAVTMPTPIERVRDHMSPTTAVILPTEQDPTGGNECLVDVQTRNHEKLIRELMSLLGNISTEQTDRAVLRRMNNDKGATWKLQRQANAV